MKTNQPQKNIWLQCDVEQLVNEGVLFKPLDGNHGGIHPKASDFVSEGIPFVMASDIYDSKVDLNKSNFITKKQADNLQKGFSLEGDVLFTHKGSVGGTAIVPSINTEYIMLTPQVTYYRVKNKERLNNHFIFYYFQSSKFQAYVKSVSGGGTRAYIGITAQLSLPFILPPLNEQNRIVSVLETWDKAIERLSKKIEVKRYVKKGLMQDLLTGKKRLKGFSDKWEVKKLGEISNLYQPQTITSEEISNSGKHKVYGANGVIGFYDKYNHEDAEILITCRGATCGTINLSEPRSWVTGNAMVANPKDNCIDKYFLYYLLIFSNLNSVITGLAQPQITRKDLSPFKIKIPKHKEEQEAIAQILTTADNEIQELQKKLQIIKEQKKYLLNNLITGTIRTPETLSIKS